MYPSSLAHLARARGRSFIFRHRHQRRFFAGRRFVTVPVSVGGRYTTHKPAPSVGAVCLARNGREYGVFTVLKHGWLSIWPGFVVRIVWSRSRFENIKSTTYREFFFFGRRFRLRCRVEREIYGKVYSLIAAQNVLSLLPRGEKASCVIFSVVIIRCEICDENIRVARTTITFVTVFITKSSRLNEYFPPLRPPRLNHCHS